MLSLNSLKKISALAVSLFAMNMVVAADQAVHGMKTSIENARHMARSAYVDGTNVVVVNWSHRPVDLFSFDTNQRTVLSPIGEDGNVYYLYSPYYYPNIAVELRDHYTHKLLVDGTAKNPSTVEVWDNAFDMRSTDASKAKLVVKTHTSPTR